jgi:hypothetical protein
MLMKIKVMKHPYFYALVGQLVEPFTFIVKDMGSNPIEDTIFKNAIMAATYGTKDLMRILDIRKKGQGNFLEEVKLAVLMANEIELPGKAMARGYASIEAYRNNYSPIAGIFFSRACELAEETDIRNIKTEASMNSVKDEEAVELAYSRIPLEKQPASRRNEPELKASISNKRGFFELLPLAKINVVKGTGPNFDVQFMSTGTIEVWRTSAGKFRIIYTGSPLPTASIEDKREFRFEDKRESWTMVDYIEVYHMMNLMPLYGTSITGYMYH